MMKKNWKGILTGGTILALLAGTLAVPTLAKVGSQTARLDYHNMKITLDGKEIQLTDSRGNSVEPFTIDGTTYLPVASLSRMLGLDVEWDGPNNTVILTTDQYVDVPADGDYIGLAKAKTIALNHAGVSASNAVFLHAKLDYDDGRRTYEVEFYSGSKEYDYEIDAATGEILSYDFDAERYTPSTSSGSSGTYISEAQAKQIVEQRAGTTGTYREFKLERDDGRTVYEGELRSGQTEYDFTIDATTGTILEWEVDR